MENNQSKIINLTQHMATQEQYADGVFEPAVQDKANIKALLTFNTLPTEEEIGQRAEAIAAIADEYRTSKAMIGGAAYLMPLLVRELKKRSIVAVHSFTERVAFETTQPDGSVKKDSKFVHLGFVEDPCYALFNFPAQEDPVEATTIQTKAATTN